MNNPCIEEGQAFAEEESSSSLAHDPPRARTCSLGLVGEDSSVCSSGDDSDDSGNGPLVDNETAASAAIQVTRAVWSPLPLLRHRPVLLLEDSTQTGLATRNQFCMLYFGVEAMLCSQA